MRILLPCLTLFLLLPCSLTGQIEAPGATFDWAELAVAYKTYLDYPSGAHAASVVALLPKSEKATQECARDCEKAIEFIDDNLGILAREVEARDREAVRLAVALISISDGGFTDELCAMLGKLSRIDPALLLEELEGHAPALAVLDNIAGGLGFEFGDHDRAQCYERERRIEAFERLKDPRVKKLRGRCIAILKEDVANFCAPPFMKAEKD